MPLSAKWIYSAALYQVRGRIRMRDAGWNLEGETATPVMQLKLWMYFIITDTSKSLYPFSTTRYVFFHLIFFYPFFLFSFSLDQQSIY